VPRIPRAVRPAYDVESLTDVAVGVFSTRGYDATRMEHIARAANISKSSLYHHVANKEALLGHALRRAVGGLTAILDEPGAQEGTASVRLEYVVRRTVETELQYLPEVSLLIRVRGNTAVERQALEERRRFQDRLATLVTEAQAAGEIGSDIDAALFIRLALGMSNSLVDWYRPDGSWSARQIADAVIQLVVKPTVSSVQGNGRRSR
jgi:AcrR family transcriptional regulator